ncbi:DegT/DnrJ/EryC1/StrS family aminotransferase [Paenibacillus macerans]|uniref:DegT/DnrJ/EryC1/StrS family aminotransferase n=1 Tax=Paenibacillus macerans TaxID=44252 RepID=UPI001F0DE730|nr:DegT/DnrJ/EryC1/StrS family aminotransferase [Paenibacillus macerans]MBS5914933.1 DegT/DnrJ/EryC1/StrS family aminotransferase [Paenibacillus macerans]MDU5945957.1 DegT/DnrJ/EryC1/StrS family aminotransferase [Paenibacillus macerans]MEC0141349.1 DegT/DnrJ/EryC1/StrS family aminotransferase [Paenibacillus macerans]UMV45311.1 DegT/DnrJ/EryC1/StrS family aminotransferase [Paenibacillus macerans]
MLLLSDPSRQFEMIKKSLLGQFETFISSGNYIMGEKVDLLEKKFAEKLGVSYAIGVGNGTDALTLALDAFGIGEGDEVITTPFTFFATAEAISRRGAKPVFADVDPLTFNLDPAKIEAAITPRTRAMIPVHLFGQPADMESIGMLAQKYGLVVIEDACQAFGARFKGKYAGSFGHAACFSFFPTKNLSTMGDGGMIVTSDPDAAAQMARLRHHGSPRKYYHDTIGYNSRLDELHALILLEAMNYAEQWNNQRRLKADRYRQSLEPLPYLQLPYEADGAHSVYHLYCLSSKAREPILAALRQAGVQAGVYYPCPLHLQKAYAGLGYRPGDLPISEQLSRQLFAIPMHPFLSESEQDYIVSILRNYGGAD